MTMRDVLDYYPYPDDYTADILADATATLAWLRGLDGDPDPVVHLHLLASLRQQLNNDLLHSALAAHDHGYTPTQIAIVLDHTT